MSWRDTLWLIAAAFAVALVLVRAGHALYRWAVSPTVSAAP